MACALHALQRHRTNLALDEAEELEQLSEEAASGRRRHHSAHKKDMSKADVNKFKSELKAVQLGIRNVTEHVESLEKYANATKELVMAIPDGGSFLSEKQEVLGSSGSLRRRRSNMPVREKQVMGVVSKSQKQMESMWDRLTRCDRLNEWCRNKLRNPASTEPWVEAVDDGDDDDESLLEQGASDPNTDAELQRSVTQLQREIKQCLLETEKKQKDADAIRQDYTDKYGKMTR